MKRLWLACAISALALTSGCADLSTDPVTTPSKSVSHGDLETTEPAETDTPDPDEAPEPEPTSEPVEEPEVPNGDELAMSVEQALLDSNVVESFIELNETSPGHAITQVEGLNDSTVRIYVQELLSDEETETTAHWVFNMSCMDEPNLNVVVIRDLGGVDRNFYANDFVRLPACS